MKKFNLVDWMIIVFVAALLIFGIYKLTYTPSKEQALEAHVVFEAEEVSEGFIEAVTTGDELYDSVSDTYIGQVIGIESEAYKEVVINDLGQPEYVSIPGKNNARIEVKVLLQDHATGYSVGNKKIIIGTTLRLKSKAYVFDGDIIDLEIQ